MLYFDSKKNMKVLHVVGGGLAGGAARGTYWLHLGLRNLGVDSRMIIQKANGSEPFVESVAKNLRGIALRSLKIFFDLLPVILYRKRERDNIIFSTGMSGFDIRKSREYKLADIIHLHWINNGMINIKLLKKIDKPIVWTMRDMWPFTGGCHYALDCTRYETGCGRCPQLRSDKYFDLSWYVLNRKKRYFPKKMTIVSISRWLAKCAKSSEVFKDFDIRVFHNNINTKDFFPIEYQVARDALGLPKKKKILLVGAADQHWKHKGFDKFQEMVHYLKEDYFFVFFGHVDHAILDRINIEYKALGYLNDNISMRLAYSAADVFAVTSIQEAFGKTLAEAMACGTPVVAFDATGPRDIVDHEKDGYLARPFEAEDLAHGIEWVMEDKFRYKELSQRASEKAKREFASENIAKKYLQLYKDVMVNKDGANIRRSM